MENTLNSTEAIIKWPEIFSLGFLNAAVVISWIAYHEYQPILVSKFQFESLVDFMILSKAIILVVIPPIAGWLADKLIAKNGKYFTVFTVGIGATAMIFMVVASMIGIGPIGAIKPALPLMIVFWLIAMNLFMSPANSMIDTFAPAHKLPVVVGFLFLVTELIYALEPVIVELVRFFGDTMTFVVGGILIATSGYLFHRVSSNEVIIRKKQLVGHKKSGVSPVAFLAILMIGLQLGLGKAFLIEFFPNAMDQRFGELVVSSGVITLIMLAVAALFAFFTSFKVTKTESTNIILIGFVGILAGVLLIFLSENLVLYLLGGLITGLSFALLNITGMPYLFRSLTVRHITYGVGIFIGASEVFTGLFEYYL